MEIPGVPRELLDALIAAADGQRLGLVGGAVRDLLLHQRHCDPWRGLPDLDVVVEGQAIELVKRLQAVVPFSAECAWREHGGFGTVEVEIRHPEWGVWLMDVASARREVYPVPGENPKVSFGSLDDDLARRDFSVNAIAMELSMHRRDTALRDPHDGLRDLAQRQLRILHPLSFVDDPTRLVRAARYCARLGFELESETLDLARDAVRTWPWSWHDGDAAQTAPPGLGTRLRMELELLVNREPWFQALSLLQAWGGLQLVDEGLQGSHRWRWALRRATRYGEPRLQVLLGCAGDPVLAAARLQLPHRQQRALKALHLLRQRLGELDKDVIYWGPYEWTVWLESQQDPEKAVRLALLCGDQPRSPLLRWWSQWRHVGAGKTAQQLIGEGLPAGPALGEELRMLRAEQLSQLEWP